MKHTQSQRPRRSGVELIQAVCTLMVLSGIYMFSTTYSSSSVSLRDAPAKPAILTSSYWNDKIGYGFTSVTWDTYVKQGSGKVDTVEILPSDGLNSDQDSLLVSFYPTMPIAEIEATNTWATPRTYSRLPNGIAMIEWDLSSDRAKTVLATLHSR